MIEQLPEQNVTIKNKFKVLFFLTGISLFSSFTETSVQTKHNEKHRINLESYKTLIIMKVLIWNSSIAIFFLYICF